MNLDLRSEMIDYWFMYYPKDLIPVLTTINQNLFIFTGWLFCRGCGVLRKRTNSWHSCDLICHCSSPVSPLTGVFSAAPSMFLHGFAIFTKPESKKSSKR